MRKKWNIRRHAEKMSAGIGEHEKRKSKHVMRRTHKHMGKGVLGLCVMLVLVLGCVGFTGCGKEAGGEEKLQNLEFTVIGEKDAPQALTELITKKKEKEFKLTYADGQDMYIVIGAGPQNGGGFSITVQELYLTENSVVIRTELVGPEKGEATGTDLSYPVLIVKTAFSENPVVFR